MRTFYFWGILCEEDAPLPSYQEWLKWRTAEEAAREVLRQGIGE